MANGNLIFIHDKPISGSLVKAYHPEWDLGGDYKTGTDFFSVHWEVHHHSPNIVRLHVESPIASKDLKRNHVKNLVIVGLLARYPKFETNTHVGKISLGKRLFETDTNKSSEVLQVQLPPDPNRSLNDSIELVDNELGDIVHAVITKLNLNTRGI